MLSLLPGVAPSLWPMLLSAAEAEAASLAGPGGDDADPDPIGTSLTRAARGLDRWRQSLERGKLWEETDGANWPCNPMLRSEWGDLLRDLDMPRFTRKHPQLVPPLLANLLETVEKFEREQQQQEQQQQQQEGQGEGEEGGEEQEGEDGAGGDSGPQAGEAAEQGGAQAGAGAAARAAAAMQEMREQWQGTMQAVRGAEEAFGSPGGEAVAMGMSLDGGSPWQETGDWKQVAALREVLSKNPDVRELIRNLGRRSALRGPMRKLPEELERPGDPLGVIRSSAAASEAKGVRLSGDWDAMLPSEAQLLAAKRPVLRLVHHMRRLERSLLSYDRTAWLEEEARALKRTEPRPLGKAGPVIVCLDTSGSMQGERETLGKAIVLESLRQAHRQGRRCYLYAFSGEGQLQELELDLTPQGLQCLLAFLRCSFSGGTSLDEALQASTERLTKEDGWRNADLMLVTDGDLSLPEKHVMDNVEAARAELGTRIVGVVLAEEAGSAMEAVCSDLYTTGSPRGEDGLYESLARARQEREEGKRRAKPPPWPQLRRVEKSVRKPEAVLARAVPPASSSRAPCRSALAGAVAPPQRLLDARAARLWHRGATSLCAWKSPAAKAGAEAQAVRYDKFDSELLAVVQEADAEARRLRQGVLGTEALLLGILSAPATAGLRQAVFGDAVQAAKAFVERSLGPQDDGKPRAKRSAGSPPLRFTPMAERALARAEEERLRHGQGSTAPAHLLLSLLQEERSEAMGLLETLNAEPETVRRRVLGTLPGAVAGVQLSAAEQLDRARAASAPRGEAAAPPALALASRLSDACALLTEGLVERSVEAKLLLLAAISGEHLFLLGPPGTAKSLLARRLASVCQGRFFERLLTRFSVPEEVFGPLSLKALENDELRRKVEGFLPDADVAFLDEVFKANSSILNALLAILNERVFDNGGSRIEVPLWTAVAASNELPESDELDALFDRFLLRRAVPRVSDGALPGFLRATLSAREPADALAPGARRPAGAGAAGQERGAVLTAADSAAIRLEAATKVVFPDHLLQVVADLRSHLRDEAEPPVLISDRRLAKAVRVIRVATYAAGGTEVSEPDLLLLEHVFWDKDPRQAAEVREWLLDRFSSSGAATGRKEDEVVPQARFLLDGLKKRLLAAVKMGSKALTLDGVGRDLEGIAQVVQSALQVRAARRRGLQALLERGSHRHFWMRPEDVLECAERLLPSAEKAVGEAEALLTEVLELQAAMRIPEARKRDECLRGLLGSSAVDPRAQSLEELNKWAAEFKLPTSIADLPGLGT